jgi:hypothetical protein
VKGFFPLFVLGFEIESINLSDLVICITFVRSLARECREREMKKLKLPATLNKLTSPL